MPPSASVVLCRYLYDPVDRLAGSVPMDQAQVRRFYRQKRLATEVQGAVQHTIFHSHEQPLAEQRHLESSITTTLLATDRQRSVVQCVDPASIQALVYGAYGYQVPQSGLGSLLGFNGERCDPLTGHYLLGNGYRAFNPVLMRFNSPDSLSPFGAGGLNAYAYCQGDPVNFQDVTGHAPASVIAKRFINKLKTKARLAKLDRIQNMDDALAYVNFGIGEASGSQVAQSSGSINRAGAGSSTSFQAVAGSGASAVPPKRGVLSFSPQQLKRLNSRLLQNKYDNIFYKPLPAVKSHAKQFIKRLHNHRTAASDLADYYAQRFIVAQGKVDLFVKYHQEVAAVDEVIRVRRSEFLGLFGEPANP